MTTENGVRDVLVVGAGPAGLMLACNLTRYGIDAMIVDDRSDKTSTGRADGLQPKTVETFRQMRLSEELLKRGVKVYDICFWDSSPTSPKLIRTARQMHYPSQVETLDPYVLLLHQGMIEDVFLDDLKLRGVEVTRNSAFVKCAANASGIMESICQDPTTNETKAMNSKYVVGCDGAHSKVRRSVPGIEMVGESGKAAWGVLDGEIETGFPDLWSKAVIHSHTAGSVLCIPRERNMTRLYIELHPQLMTDLPSEVASQDFVMNRAREIFLPYKLEWKSVEWFSVYKVGQRVASSFMSPDSKIILTGDACHTHSPKAAQGMNVSMHDSFNLAWKMNLTLRGLAKPCLLESYAIERRQIAQQLIDFDHEHANAFATGDPEALAKNFDDNIRFISGVGAEYDPNPVVLNSSICRAGKLRAGTLLLPAKVTRYIDANPIDLQLDIPLLSQFRVYVFTHDVHASKTILTALCQNITGATSVLGRASALANESYSAKPAKLVEADDYIRPERYTAVSKLFTLSCVVAMDKSKFEISDLPPAMNASRWTVYVDDIGGIGACSKAYFGELVHEVAVVNVRPDGYVGSLGVFKNDETEEACKWMDTYYSTFLNA